MLTINTNISSLIAQNSLKQSTNKLNTAIERMSTGFKINHSKDNAANYSISTNMSTKIGAYNVAEDNTAMGLDLVTTASDTIAMMQDKGERLRALCIQAKNGTYGEQSMDAIASEANAIISEINRIFKTAQYNGVSFFEEPTAEAIAEPAPAIAMFAMRSATTTSTGLRNVDDLDAVKDVDEAEGFTKTEYKIEDIEDLKQLARLVNDVGLDTNEITFVMADNIDIGEYCDEELANNNGGWTPIGSYTNSFDGVFDGNGFVIKNLKIDRDDVCQGLFGAISSDGEVKNVGIVGGSVKGSTYTGSLIGLTGGNTTNCFSTCDVQGTNDGTGGLIGASVGTVSNCYSTGNVTGVNYVGGLVGANDGDTINSIATGNITGTGDDIGGLIGQSQGTVNNSYATGNVSGDERIGGLVGIARASIDNSFATGTVTGNADVYGLVGDLNNCTITNSASVQSDPNANSILTEEQIKSTYTTQSMGFTEANGWTIVNGQPLLSWQEEAKTAGNSGSSNNTTGFSGSSNYGLQVGIDGKNSSRIEFSINLSYDLSVVSDNISSDEALSAIDNFIAQLSEQSTVLGSVQNRLESVLEEISIQRDNLVSSRSTIKDADIAEVSSTYIQQQILQQASATLLATANQTPSIALQLI